MLQKKIPSDQLLPRIGRERIDARQVGDRRLRVTPDHAVLAVHRDTGEIAYMLVGAGQLVEQGRFAAVLVARQSKGQRLAFGDSVPRFVLVVAGRIVKFPAARMGYRRMPLLRGGCTVAGVNAFNRDLTGVIQAQRQFIPTQFQLDGVPHRRHLPQGDLGARRQPHIQQVAAQGTAAAHRPDQGVLPDL